ncbi:MAG TPA: MOSC N-terminal beta barrel domain-containing protein [Coleofasciculaceae cyanobacterium]
MQPYLAAIDIYPIKSLDPVALTQATLLNSGAIQHDREFALVDEQGRFVNGKRHAKIHQLRSTFDPELQWITLQIQGTKETVIFHLDGDRMALEAWFSDFFGFSVKLIQNTLMGFPDDTNASGPTVISTHTLQEVASWFPGISVDEIRHRLRANLEIGGVPPFWEDQLFAQEGQCVQFRVGDVLLQGINPCQRCVVPTRDSQTGEVTANFQKIFSQRRRETLPHWTTPSRFNHFYKLSVNTNVPKSEAGKQVHCGDAIALCH